MKLCSKQSLNQRIIFTISLLNFSILMFYIFMDGLGKKGSSGVSGFIEQDNLRKSLGDWYQLVFYTFQVNLYFSITGILYAFFNNQTIKNLFFCSVCFLLFCLFAISVFEFKSFKTNAYESSKTLFVHLIIPISGFIMLFMERKKILLKWSILFINSFYLFFYISLSLIIYYQVHFASDSQYPNEPLWIYGFLDYKNQIMFIPLPTQALSILGIVVTLFITPFIGLILFLFIKLIFNIKIQEFSIYNFFK